MGLQDTVITDLGDSYYIIIFTRNLKKAMAASLSSVKEKYLRLGKLQSSWVINRRPITNTNDSDKPGIQVSFFKCIAVMDLHLEVLELFLYQKEYVEKA